MGTDWKKVKRLVKDVGPMDVDNSVGIDYESRGGLGSGGAKGENWDNSSVEVA